MEAYPFLIREDGSGDQLEPAHRQGKAYNEAWLQELLRQHPDILPAAEIEPVFFPLVSIGREVATATGAIDNLFISPQGYLVLVETKLWRNPEARRDVVAQAIDYGSSLARWRYGDLDKAVRSYTRAYEGGELSLVDWVEGQWGPIEGGSEYFEETVARNLRLGRFLTLIVGDRIRQSVVDLLEYVNRFPHLATDVALVELRCYQWQPDEDWPLLVVPSVVARTEIVERSVVQVTLQPEVEHELAVRQERAASGRKRGPRVTLTEEAFWELLGQEAPDDLDGARELIARYQEREEIEVVPGSGSLILKLTLPETGEQVSCFFLDRRARLHVWPNANQMKRAGLVDNATKPYDTEMRRLFNIAPGRNEILRPIGEVDVEQFVDAVDTFIDRVLSAERTD